MDPALTHGALLQIKAGQRPTAIARYLGIHRSTLWRERRRNAPRPLYDARLAQAATPGVMMGAPQQREEISPTSA